MAESNQLDRRTKAFKDIVALMPKKSAEIEETIDGEVFRYQEEPRCRVCSAADPKKGTVNGQQVRELVDGLLLYPQTYADIYRTIEPMMAEWPPKARITYKSLRTHQNNHLGWDRLAVREMVEHYAQEKGLSVIQASNRMILTQEAWLEATAHFAWQRLLDGRIEPSWAEGQKAFEQMDAIKKMGEGEFSVAHLKSQLNTVIQVIRQYIPEEHWDQIISQLEGAETPALPVATDDDEFDMISNEQAKFASEE